MVTVMKSVAVADAAVGKNLAAGETWEQDSMPRMVTQFGVVGGNSVGECVLELYYGSKKVGEFMTTTSGASKTPTPNTDIVPVTTTWQCFPRTSIALKVKSAPTTNAIVFFMNIAELPRTRNYGQGYAYGRRY